MNTMSLPTRPITSAEDLMNMLRGNEKLPNTLDEAKQIMAMPPDSWFGKTILFPRVVSPAQTEGQGDVVVSESILSYSFDETSREWKAKYLLAGRKGWGRSGPDHVSDLTIIPRKA